MLPIAPSHAHVGEEREERGRGERNRDFNALLINFSSCSKLEGD
jgi:hypothetical protein